VDFFLGETPEIKKDLAKIHVKDFQADFELFLKALPQMVKEKQFYHHHKIFRISNLGRIEGAVFKAKKIHCRSLRANDKFRVIFQIVSDKILVLEVYFKGQKENEDKERIFKYCGLRN